MWGVYAWKKANISVVNPANGSLSVHFDSGFTDKGWLQLPGESSIIMGRFECLAAIESESGDRSPLSALAYRSRLEEHCATAVQFQCTSHIHECHFFLLENPARTFNPEIAVFWSMFWNDIDDEMRTIVRSLIQNGQLEFAGGGVGAN
jgi:hypothetical protein